MDFRALGFVSDFGFGDFEFESGLIEGKTPGVQRVDLWVKTGPSGEGQGEGEFVYEDPCVQLKERGCARQRQPQRSDTPRVGDI